MTDAHGPRRYCLAATACLLLSLSSAALAAPQTLTVAADGGGDCKTIAEALARVPDNSAERTIIRLKPGVYEGQIVVPRGKNRVTFRGDDAATTLLTYDKNVRDPVPDGQNPQYKGDGVVIDGDDFEADNLTFRNASGDHGQAMALRVDGDREVFRRCRLLGWQDTLLCWTGRQYFQDCYIEGRVDFIYGAATAVFDHCEIHSKNGGHVTAASTPQDHPYGFVFLHCHLTGDPAPWADPTGETKAKPANRPVMADLGRPWRPYGAVAYIDCEMDAHIKPEGWNNWGKTENEKTARYSEYNSSGPGANPDKRASWSKQLTSEEAANYTVPNILGGTDNWNPALGAKASAARQGEETRDARVRIVLAGDSTVTDEAGWAKGFKAHLKSDVACVNLSRGGRSSKSFRAEGLWARALSLKPNYVLIQFGHNDQPGHGPDRETDPSTTYRENIARYVEEARAAGVTPVLVTPLSRRQFGADGKVHSTLAPYADAVRAVAAEKKVPLIDLQAKSIALWDRLGPTGCHALAPHKDGGDGYDGTHLNAQGSAVIGKIVADALVQAVPALASEVTSATP